METSLKTGFAQISLAAQKIRVAQNLGGPPGPYAYGSESVHHGNMYTFGTKITYILMGNRTEYQYEIAQMRKSFISMAFCQKLQGIIHGRHHLMENDDELSHNIFEEEHSSMESIN